MKKLLLIIAFLLSAQSAHAALPKAPNNLGLVGYWNFNEGTGLKAGDASGNGNTGTLTNGPTWAGGKLGGALRFDGTDDYVDLGTGASLDVAGGNSTISVWAKWTTATGNTRNIVQLGANTARFQIATGFNAGGQDKLSIVYGNGTGLITDLYDVGSGLNNGAWHHLLVTKTSGGTVTVYIDGVVTATPNSGVANISTSNSIGSGVYGAFSGSIDEVRIYSRALGANEITKLYNAGSSKLMGSTTEAGTASGLVGHWKLDDRAGTRAIDSSSSGNNGTLTNFALAGATSNWGSGRLSGGLHFDGVNDYVQVSIASLTGAAPTAETWSMWVKPSSIGTQILLENAPLLGASQSRRYIKENADGTLTMVPCDVAFSANTTSALRVDQWTHVVVVSNGSNHKIYMNGQQEVSSTIVATCALSTVTSFGYGYAWYFHGYMDDIRVYNRALNADEVKSLYTSGSSRPTTANTNSAALTAGTNLASGLVGHWTFDGKYLSTTTARDTSGNNNHGALTNGPVPIMGKMGQALSFDGTDDVITLGDALDANTFAANHAFSLSGWVYPTSHAKVNVMLSKYENPYATFGREFYFGMSNSSDGKPVLAIYDADEGGGGVLNAYFYSVSNTAIPLNSWSFVTATYDGGTSSSGIKIYINGSVVSATSGGSGVFTQVRDTPAQLRIGRYVDGTSNGLTNGSIDEVRIYNRALSAAEVKQLYNLGK